MTKELIVLLSVESKKIHMLITGLVNFVKKIIILLKNIHLQQMSISALPNELIYQIMYSASPKDLFLLCQCDKRLLSLCSDPYFWAKRAQIDFDYPLNDFLDYAQELSGLNKYNIIRSELAKNKFTPISPKDDPFRVKVRLYYYKPTTLTLYDLIRAYNGESELKDNMLEIIEILLNYDELMVSTIQRDVLSLAAAKGDLDIFKLLMQNKKNRENIKSINKGISRTHNLDIIKFILDTIDNVDISGALYNAAIYDNMEILNYLLNNYEFSGENLATAVDYASNNEAINVLVKLLENQDIIINCSTLQFAILNGQENVVEILLQHPGIHHCLIKRMYDDAKYLKRKNYGSGPAADLVLNHPMMKIYR